MLFRKAYIPIQRCDHSGDKRMLQPGSYESAKEHHVSLLDLATSMSHLWDNVQGLVIPALAPPLKRQPCISKDHLVGREAGLFGLLSLPRSR
eukprot:Skav211655  [mRNA]  locus=scaffold2752:46991:47266:- [translate_table: standard]